MATPKIDTFLKGSRWRITGTVNLYGGTSLDEGTNIEVVSNCNTTHSMWLRVVNSDSSLAPKKQICHWPTPWTFELLKQSEETFYSLRLKDGRVLRNSAHQSWRYGNLKLYQTLRGAIDRLATDCSLGDTEVIKFNVNGEGEMDNIVVHELPPQWRERVAALKTHNVRLGSALLKDEWEVALIFQNDQKDGLFDETRTWKVRTNSKVKFANNLSRRWRDPWVFLYKSRIEAIKHRLALPDCEMVSLNA
jgi:hypothetical protein